MTQFKRMARRWMPRRVLDVWRYLATGMSEFVAKSFGRVRWLSIAYYAVFSRAFWREFYAVMYGRRRHLMENGPNGPARYKLRRNIHRLEKGLLMRPRRDVFALGYIQETVTAYSQAARMGLSEDGTLVELEWAMDVLDAYFDIVGYHPAVEAARALYNKNRGRTSDSTREVAARVPYRRILDQPPPISFDDFRLLSQQRRSVRWFLPHPVPRNLIDKAIETALQAPSACNRQPFVFRVIDEPDRVREVASIPMGTAGFYDNFPVVVVVIGRLRAYFSHRDRHVVYVDAALASMALIFALETLGLSSCPINWPDIEPRERQMAAALDLDPDERPVMLIALGYPDPEGMVAYSQKRTIEDVRIFN